MVVFEIVGELPPIYQCHCSLCRKVSGSSSNSAMIVKADNFNWVSGQNLIGEYSTASGFKSEFCRNCGSPVPNLTSDSKSYWVPAGLLLEPVNSEVITHVYVDSRATWDTGFLSDNLPKFKQRPSELEFLKLMHKHTHDN